MQIRFFFTLGYWELWKDGLNVLNYDENNFTMQKNSNAPKMIPADMAI